MAEFGWILHQAGKLPTMAERMAAADGLCAEVEETRRKQKVVRLDDYRGQDEWEVG